MPGKLLLQNDINTSSVFNSCTVISIQIQSQGFTVAIYPESLIPYPNWVDRKCCFIHSINHFLTFQLSRYWHPLLSGILRSKRSGGVLLSICRLQLSCRRVRAWNGGQREGRTYRLQGWACQLLWLLVIISAKQLLTMLLLKHTQKKEDNQLFKALEYKDNKLDTFKIYIYFLFSLTSLQYREKECW